MLYELVSPTIRRSAEALWKAARGEGAPALETVVAARLARGDGPDAASVRSLPGSRFESVAPEGDDAVELTFTRPGRSVDVPLILEWGRWYWAPEDFAAEETGGGEASPAGLSPRATFLAMKHAMIARNWSVLYRLTSPAERAAAEEKWDRARRSDADRGKLAPVAAAVGAELPEVVALPFPELFRRYQARRAEVPDSPLLRLALSLKYVKTVPGKDDRATVLGRFGKQQLRVDVRFESGRWYLSGNLSKLTSF